ncbi:MAG: hypothetical protein IKM45_05185 [Opitutales bacterium]|nr:hypothetical protein [Opitutales bacterium]
MKFSNPPATIRTTYAYAPFGNVSASDNISWPFRWASEVYDLVYYNYL